VEDTTDNIAALEKTYALRILALILEEGPISRTNLYHRMSSSPRTPQDRVKELIELGLLQEVPRPSDPRMRILDLTPKGKRIADLASKMKKEMKK